MNSVALDAGETAHAVAVPDSALPAPDPTTVFDFVPATLPPTGTTDLYLEKSTVFTSFATGLITQPKTVIRVIEQAAASLR